MARTQLNFRLSEEQKERWQEHVEDVSRYDDTVSDLVRRAVENQIDRDNGDAQPTTADVDVSGVESGEILERLQDLRNDMQALQSDVSNAVDAVHASSGVDPDLAPAVFNALPTGEENAKTEGEITDVVAEEGHDWDMSAVRFALENLRKNTNTVVKIPEGQDSEGHMTQTRWYVERGA